MKIIKNIQLNVVIFTAIKFRSILYRHVIRIYGAMTDEVFIENH